jgi:hypothetical protein
MHGTNIKLLLRVFTMKWFSVSQTKLDKQQRVTTLSYAFPSKCLTDWKCTDYTKLVRWNFLKTGSIENLENWWTRGYQLFEARSLARPKRLRYSSCPSFLLPPSVWARLPLEGYPWKFILQSLVKSAAKFETWLQLGETIGKFTRRLHYVL